MADNMNEGIEKGMVESRYNKKKLQEWRRRKAAEQDAKEKMAQEPGIVDKFKSWWEQTFEQPAEEVESVNTGARIRTDLQEGRQAPIKIKPKTYEERMREAIENRDSLIQKANEAERAGKTLPEPALNKDEIEYYSEYGYGDDVKRSPADKKRRLRDLISKPK